jgi:energy-coupling factor transporter ATP-binding protein EcfA2
MTIESARMNIEKQLRVKGNGLDTGPPAAMLDDDIEEPLVAVRGSAFVQSFKAPDAIIEAVPATSHGRLIALTGATGHGKTTLAALFQVHIASGKSLAGCDVEQGRVLVLCGENEDDYNAHLNATMHDLGLQPADLDNILVVPSRFPIDQEFDRLLAEVRKFGELTAVFVDTSVAYFFGEDDNANMDQFEHAKTLRRLTELPGNPVVFVACHPIKNANRDSLLPRGGGAFLNEVDANLTLWRENEIVTLHWAGKMRGPNFDPIQFELRTVELPFRDAKGRATISVAAHPISAAHIEEIEQRAVRDEDVLLVAMQKKPEATVRELALACGWVSGMGLPSTSRVDRHMKALERVKLAEKNHRGRWTLTRTGKKEADKLP